MSENNNQPLNRVFIYDYEKKTTSGFNDDVLVIADTDIEKFNKLIGDILLSDEPKVVHSELCVLNPEGHFTLADVDIICVVPKKNIVIAVNDTGVNCRLMHSRDRLTGLYSKNAFSEMVGNFEAGTVVIYFDIQRFKMINDMFGIDEGDRLLRFIANIIVEESGKDGTGCRLDSDRFVFTVKIHEDEIGSFIESFFDKISDFDLPFEVLCNAGVYIVGDEKISIDRMVDRAIMAQSSIKGSYTKRYNIYTEAIRKNLLTEQEITGMMKHAMKHGHFLVYYQPQYNHSTGMLVGAEGLVRWKHPEKGIISPAVFIPVFEKNGFITQLDLYVFEKVCQFLRKCIDMNVHLVPISTNLTRYDIFSPDFIEKLEETRKKYNVPSKYLRIEITESAALGNSQFINDAVRKLHSYGYVVEMDDFGSGYSSLNILKDIDFDIIKLDMKFLEKNQNNNKGGTILSSVVRMVNWLGLPIIAEGVEDVKQADFLKSIGCEYIQGYLYSKPLPENEFEALISGSEIGATIPQLKLTDNFNYENFWSNDSLETLIFSNFVGGAAIFEYHNNNIEILRVNQKYLAELGMNLSEREIFDAKEAINFDDENRKIFMDMLKKAIETLDEQECETWRTIKSPCCGEEKMCIRTTVRVIGQSKESTLFYSMIRNVTAEKLHISEIVDGERRFKWISDQLNVYFWEYNVLSHEMKPCFRCMRDLGLPPLLTNYPESVFKTGIFPDEFHDTYREWHKQIENGVKSLEAVVPLTADRIPFRVRYTTEFDETGRPIKAYGSAELIVND